MIEGDFVVIQSVILLLIWFSCDSFAVPSTPSIINRCTLYPILIIHCKAKNQRMTFFRIITLFFISLNFVSGQNKADSSKIKSITDIDNYIIKTMSDNKIPALSLGLIKNGKVVYCKNFGVQDITTKVPISNNMLYNMASTTKMFTAIAIMKLVEQQKIALDSTVTKYLPYFKTQKGDYSKITIRQLLSHTSGLPRELYIEDWERQEYGSEVREVAVKNLRFRELECLPGEAFGYSNLGYMVLADVVTKVSGLDFEDFITATIIKPCEMNSSSMYNYTLSKNQQIIPHHNNDSIIVPIYKKETGADADILSNVPDMLNWLIMNLNEGSFKQKQIITKKSFKTIVTSNMVKEMGVGRGGTGLGYEIYYENNIVRYGHSGRTRGGFKNHTYFFPANKAAIVVVGSLWSEAIDNIFFKMVEFILNEKK